MVDFEYLIGSLRTGVFPLTNTYIYIYIHVIRIHTHIIVNFEKMHQPVRPRPPT